MTRSELSSFLDGLFPPIKDHTYNGLQFEGTENINTIAFAVDVSEASLRAAKEIKADALITHHGLIWGGLKRIEGVDRLRIGLLCAGNINLFTYHLPLDIHPELGNNAVLMERLGLKNTGNPFFEVGFYGECALSYPEFTQRVRERVNKQIIEIPFGSKNIRHIALCSGGAGSLSALMEAHQGGADTLFTGETSSLTYHHAKELEMNIICAGHYATEVFGVQALQEKICHAFPNVATKFLDLPTGW